MTGKSISGKPIQKLPMSKKTLEWKEANVDYYVGRSGFTGGGDNNGRSRIENMQTFYDLYNSIYNEKDLKYVTNPFKQNDGFPASAQDYNIIKPKIDLLLGEETKRPFNFRVVRTSDIATSDVLEKTKLLLIDYAEAAIMSKLGPEELKRFLEGLLSGEIMTPEAIQKYISKDYKDIGEVTAHHSLNYLVNKLNISHEFFKGWKDALIAGEELYYVGIINGLPFLERVNPTLFNYDQTADLEFIHDADWCCRKMIMSASEVYDRFYDKMTEKQLNLLLDSVDSGSGSHSSELRKGSMDYHHLSLKPMAGVSDKFSGSENVQVWHTCWRSYKKIGFVTILNPETEAEEEFEVDESYKTVGTEVNVEWVWIVEVWEGYRIGDDLYVGVQPLDYQHISSENPNSLRLPYTGVVYNNTNSAPRSLVSFMKPLQYMYIVLWYRLELAMSRDKGKVAVMDLTQIPKSMNIDVNKWMHYLSALGVAFINPYEEGWDVPGREGGKASQFNQLQVWDLTMASTIDLYINLMDKIESMVSEISGVSKQRAGAISSSELVGNVERAVVLSSHITEPLFWVHNLVKREVLTMLLNTAKVAWKGNKSTLHYILDDITRAFIDLSDDFFYEDMDIFVSDSTKNQQQLEALKALMQPAMLNGASILDMAEIITMENINMIKNKLEDIEQKRSEQQLAQQDQQSEREQAMLAMQNEVKEEELMLKEAELDMMKYKIDQDNATKITTAQLNAYRGTADMDQDKDGIPDPMLIASQALAERKHDSETANKQFELNAKTREAELKRDIENKKIQVEREKMLNDIKLLKLKDSEAYKRESLKAKTVLKNKVSGE